MRALYREKSARGLSAERSCILRSSVRGVRSKGRAEVLIAQPEDETNVERRAALVQAHDSVSDKYEGRSQARV